MVVWKYLRSVVVLLPLVVGARQAFLHGVVAQVRQVVVSAHCQSVAVVTLLLLVAAV